MATIAFTLNGKSQKVDVDPKTPLLWVLRDVLKRGHTVGSHTMTHANLRKKKTPQEGIDEIEKGLSAVKRAAGQPIAPFFRYPFLQDSPETLDHLAKRNLALAPGVLTGLLAMGDGACVDLSKGSRSLRPITDIAQKRALQKLHLDHASQILALFEGLAGGISMAQRFSHAPFQTIELGQACLTGAEFLGHLQ